MRISPPIVLVAIVLQACGVPQSPTDFDKTPEAQFLKATVNQLLDHDYSAIQALMDERVHQTDIQQALERLRSAIPNSKPTTLNPVAWNYLRTNNTSNGGKSSRAANVAIEYCYPGPKWVVASASLSGEPGKFRIVSFNVESLQTPLSELNAFTFKGKGFVHYLFLLSTALAFSVSAYGFVRCLLTKGVKRKWLWALFTLVGFLAVSNNWTSGAISVDFLRFNLLSAAFMRNGWAGPWAISFAVPVGALVFLWKHRAGANGPLADA